MNDLKIAVFPHVLSSDIREPVRKAAELGLEGLHASTTGPLEPELLDAQARRDLVDLFRAHDVVVSAISYWGGQVDLGYPEQHEAAIPAGKRALQLAADLECGLWQAHVGIMPWETENSRWQAFLDALGELTAYGEQVGATLCLETGPEPPWVLKRMIQALASPALGINLDPANLIIWRPMVAQDRGVEYTPEWGDENFGPENAATLLGPWVRHTHAKDARQEPDGTCPEVALGQGDIDWVRYVSNLMAAGYEGFFAVERECGEDPVGDVMRAVDFLRGLPV